ncbi:hypothetical protein D1872_265520 [compost metagenome]
MCCHDGIHARLNGLAKRQQFYLLQSLPPMGNGYHAEMRIHGRISMPWKMLRCCGYAPRLISCNGCRTMSGHLLRVFPIGSHSNHRI